jgi:hypothetical protein
MAQGTAQVKIITTAGKQAKQQRLVGTAANAFTYIALGIGNTTDAAAADTTLGSEITTGGLARVNVTPTVVNGVVTWSYTFTASASFTVSEVGIFNASSAGTMYLHSTLGTANFVSVVSGNLVKVIVSDTE